MMENMTHQNRKYYDEITIARGIGILLVVLGHALKQTGVTNTAVDVLIEVIYSFHMPLFFVLSGFVSVKILQYTKAEEYIRYIKSRMLRLLLPYFVMGILYMPLKYFLSRFARNPYDFSAAWKLVIGINPNTTMWFLYTLFWVSVTALFFVKRRVLLPMLALSFILSAAAFSFDWGIRTPKYLFFFILGLCIREHYEEFLHWKEKKWCVALAAALFLGCNAALYGGFSAAEFITSVTGSILCIILSSLVRHVYRRPCRGIENAGREQYGYLYFVRSRADGIAIAIVEHTAYTEYTGCDLVLPSGSGGIFCVGQIYSSQILDIPAPPFWRKMMRKASAGKNDS